MWILYYLYFRQYISGVLSWKILSEVFRPSSDAALTRLRHYWLAKNVLRVASKEINFTGTKFHVYLSHFKISRITKNKEFMQFRNIWKYFNEQNIFVVRIIMTYWLYFLFHFLPGIIWTLCEKTGVTFVSRTFVVYHDCFFSNYIFIRVLIILIQKKWGIETQLRYV